MILDLNHSYSSILVELFVDMNLCKNHRKVWRRIKAGWDRTRTRIVDNLPAWRSWLCPKRFRTQIDRSGAVLCIFSTKDIFWLTVRRDTKHSNCTWSRESCHWSSRTIPWRVLRRCVSYRDIRISGLRYGDRDAENWYVYRIFCVKQRKPYREDRRICSSNTTTRCPAPIR